MGPQKTERRSLLSVPRVHIYDGTKHWLLDNLTPWELNKLTYFGGIPGDLYDFYVEPPVIETGCGCRLYA